MRFLIVITFFVFSLSPQELVVADIISTTFDSSVSADFSGTIDSDSSTAGIATLSAFAADNNSFTQSDLAYAWDGSILTGSSLIEVEKTISARPGGDHVGISLLEFTFEVDQNTEFSLNGTWGFDTANPGGDTLAFTLTSLTGTVAQDSSTGTTGIASDTFSSTGTLGPGTYTLTFNGQLTETVNNQNTVLGGWTINQFSLITAVPEPSAAFLLFSLLAYCQLRRKRNSIVN